MDLYIVKPNLEIADCENCPSDSTLLAKKSAYLSLLKQCNKLSQMNGGEAQTPSWCRCHTNTAPGKTGSKEDKAAACLSLQSITLTPQDYKKLEPRRESLSLARLDLPNNISAIDGKWLALKYLQLNSDVALMRYKYMKSYAKITKLLKKYFSKPQVSESEESEGLTQINDEMSKFRTFENILTLLLELKKQFHARFSHFDTTTVAASAVADSEETASSCKAQKCSASSSSSTSPSSSPRRSTHLPSAPATST